MTIVAYVQIQPEQIFDENRLNQETIDKLALKAEGILNGYATLAKDQGELIGLGVNFQRECYTRNGKIVPEGATLRQFDAINAGLETAGYEDRETVKGNLSRVVIVASLHWRMNEDQLSTLDSLMKGIEMRRVYNSEY